MSQSRMTLQSYDLMPLKTTVTEKIPPNLFSDHPKALTSGIV